MRPFLFRLFHISWLCCVFKRSHAFRILYPWHELYSQQADEGYHEEFLAAKERGIDCSFFDFDFENELDHPFRPSPKINAGEIVLYRGWMMNSVKYETFVKMMDTQGGRPLTGLRDYLRCHYLPGWYDDCADMTAKTHVVQSVRDIVEEAEQLGWDGFFVKDYVKSNSGRLGSIARSSTDIPLILDELKQYRGELEGGVVLRQVEKYADASEQRYFVANQTVFGPNDEVVPSIVQTVAQRIDSPFYSVDVAITEAGEVRVVELGDGQVSDKKNWPLEKFVSVLEALQVFAENSSSY